MRTTIDLKPEHRSALLALAARRRKGLSAVLEEVIASYLDQEKERDRRCEIIRSLAGSISKQEAEDLRCLTRQIAYR